MNTISSYVSSAQNISIVRKRIEALSVEFEFAEVETYEKLTLQKWASGALPEGAYRARIFGKKGQVEFRQTGDWFHLAALVPGSSETHIKGWEKVRVLQNGEDEIYYLDNNLVNFRKAEIKVYRDPASLQITAAWWRKLV